MNSVNTLLAALPLNHLTTITTLTEKHPLLPSPVQSLIHTRISSGYSVVLGVGGVLRPLSATLGLLTSTAHQRKSAHSQVINNRGMWTSSTAILGEDGLKIDGAVEAQSTVGQDVNPVGLVVTRCVEDGDLFQQY